MIQAATSDDCIAEDWATFVDIADRVKAFKDPEQLREALRFLRKRLQSRQPRAVYLALTLTESLAKNCGLRLLQAMDADEKFLPQLSKVAKDLHKKTDRNALEAYRKCLDLIQAWGEEFLPIQDEYGLRNFVRLYHELRVQGYRFSAPQLDETRPPIFTPPPSAPSGGGGGASAATGGKSHHTGGGGDKPQLPGELGVVQNMVLMCSEMMHAAESDGDILRNDVLRDMLSTLKDSERIVQQSLEDLMATQPQLVEPALKLNDDAHMLLQFYNKVKRDGLPPPGERNLPVDAPSVEPERVTGASDAGEGAGGGPGTGAGEEELTEEDLLGDLLGGGPAAPAPSPAARKAPPKEQSPPNHAPTEMGKLESARRRSSSSRSGPAPRQQGPPTIANPQSNNSPIPSIRPPPGSSGGRARASSGRRHRGTNEDQPAAAATQKKEDEGEPEDDFFAAIDSAKGDSTLQDDPFDDPFQAPTSATPADPFGPANKGPPAGSAAPSDDAWWLETSTSQPVVGSGGAERANVPTQQPRRGSHGQGHPGVPHAAAADPFEELMGGGGQVHGGGSNTAGSNPFDALAGPSGPPQQPQQPPRRPSGSQNPFDMF